MPDEEAKDRKPFPRTGLVLLLTTTALAAIPPAAPWDEVKPSLMIALAAAAGWFANRGTALALCGVWAILERAVVPLEMEWMGFVVRYAVMVGFILAVSQLNVRLTAEHRRARLDALTGLPNRQAFRERCQAELSRAKRFQRPLTVVLLDGDRFKTVNDERGHAAGDQALQATASVLAATIRRYDFAARLGGDEFALLFPETSAADAEAAARRLQRALAEQIGQAFAPLTYSLGVATFPPGDWEVDRCLEETDRLLYEAKRAGTGEIRRALIVPPDVR